MYFIVNECIGINIYIYVHYLFKRQSIIIQLLRVQYSNFSLFCEE